MIAGENGKNDLGGCLKIACRVVHEVRDLALYLSMLKEGSLEPMSGMETVPLLMPALTAPLASYLLKECQPEHGQRRASIKLIRTIAEDLKDGKFHEIGSPLRLDPDGFLVDGQHRCRAVVESGVPLPATWLIVLFNWDALMHIDTHRKLRTVTDIIQMQNDDYLHPSAIGALTFEHGNFQNSSLSTTQRYRLIRDSPFREFVHRLFLKTLTKVGGKGPGSAFLAGAVRCARDGDAALAEKFFTAAFSNQQVIDNYLTPQARVLFDFCIATRLSHPSRAAGSMRQNLMRRRECAVKAIMAYNAWVEKRSLQRLIWKGASIPRVSTARRV